MLERLYVHNFRCLENFKLELAGRPSALMIGRNGAGKSTVLRCLELFQSICRGAGRVGNLISTSDFARLRTDEPMRFEAEVTLGGRILKYAISFEWPPNFREARILEENLWADGSPVFTRHHGQIQLSGGPTFGLDWHIFALPVINERPGERTIQDLKGFFASMLLIAPMPPVMTGYSEEASTELAYDASNYASCLRALLEQRPAAYATFESYVRQAIPDFSSIENVARGESGKQLMVRFDQQHPQRSLSVEFKSLSDGEKCYFLSAYIIAAITAGSSVVCMWDEPDNHLSLSQVGHFVTSLRKMTNKNGQFIATTHHPETIRKFSDETTIVLTRRSHLDPTVVKPLTDIPYSGDLIHALIRDEIIE